MGPLIFYDYIDIKECQTIDIIEEIKESKDNPDKNITQLMKYGKCYITLKNSEEINTNLRLRLNSHKTLLYVFNSSYKNYLMKLMESKNHYTEFCFN